MMGVFIAGVRSRIQQLLDSHDYLSHEEIQRELEFDYGTVNRALNSPPNPVLGETPFARMRNPEPGALWLYFAVRPERPLAQSEFGIKTKTAHTQLLKTRDQLLRPAIAAGATATGDGDDLDQSLVNLEASIHFLELARRAGAIKAENEARSQELRKEEAELKARREELEKEEAEFNQRRREFTEAAEDRSPRSAQT
ncbi:hypothetical protein AB0C33_15335 [Nonomuraea sp. NPDC048881]|uniref:hypothetical protein n=1 Tax=Nonomuraea sp. NPDC048881 TaxID=3155030 RepID=UPI0034117DFA